MSNLVREIKGSVTVAKQPGVAHRKQLVRRGHPQLARREGEAQPLEDANGREELIEQWVRQAREVLALSVERCKSPCEYRSIEPAVAQFLSESALERA